MPELTESILPATLAEPARTIRYDAVVIGAGVAGLTFVLKLPPTWQVALLTKGVIGESNTRYAQGGLSAAIGADDETSLHETDTLVAGAGLCDERAVHEMVEGAPEAVDWLVDLGAEFDRDPKTGEIVLGREAAHSRWRVLHAGGDATGAEIERALVANLRTRPNTHVYEHAFAIDLLRDEGRCTGVLAVAGERDDDLLRLEAPVTVLAAGGAGQLWALTSNPSGATADGQAMAIRAGVTVADLEFVQFHPTVLVDPNGSSFLISEAVRGEGAYLRNAAGERFMQRVHDLAELAPRDVVARGNHRAMLADGSDHIYLDLRHLDPEAMHKRFPTISQELRLRGIDLARDPIPVAPASHYFIGGPSADIDGTTSLPGLLALGEASCTGVHGANRLASNSLLEGLVFGGNAAAMVAATGAPSAPPVDAPATVAHGYDWTAAWTPDLAALRDRLKQAMSRWVAVERDADGLDRAAAEIAAIRHDVQALGCQSRAAWTVRNMADTSLGIIGAARHREESRGAHYRGDFPAVDAGLDGRHSLLREDGATWEYGTLAEGRRVAT